MAFALVGCRMALITPTLICCVSCSRMEALVIFSDLTPVEQATVRHTVTDKGPGIWNSPFIGASFDAVGRYLTEGGTLLPARDWRHVWECITDLLTHEPNLVTGPPPTQEDLAARQNERNHRAEQLLADALAALRTGDYERAHAFIAQAELAAPQYQPRGRTYATLRGFVDNTRNTASTHPGETS